MGRCPKCNSLEAFCEEVDLVNGEITGYHCTQCGYEEVEIEE